MIDIENLVFDTVYTGLHTSYPNANISSGYDEENAIFPAVVVRQTNNQPYREANTDDCAENYTRVTFEIEVFSDKESTGRSECKELLIAADDIMQSMKFRRIHLNRPINIDRTLWRQYARYEVIVGKPVTYDAGTANERTVYQMYRR
jgi:hypothetical protein